MRISCGECRTDFRVDPTKIPSGGIRARCSVCGAVIGLGLPDWGGLWEPPMSGRGATDWDLDHHVALESDAEAAPESYEGSTVGLTRVPSGGVPATAASTLTPRLASAARPPAAGASPPPAADEDDWGFPDQWATEVPRRAAARAGEQATAIRGPSVPPARPALRPTAAVSTIATVRRPATVMAPGRPAVPLAISSPGAMPTAPRAPAGPASVVPAPIAPIPAERPRASVVPPAAPVAPVAAPGAAPTAAPATPSGIASKPTSSAPWKNPFLRSDPHEKARRLASALVSDIVAYHPAVYAEARAAGTLRESLREEIEKSHEDYVDQVGQALADSTSYFRDALNTILAGGQPVF